MKSRMIMVERLDLVSSKSFEQVLLELDKGIGRPVANYFEQKAVAKSFEEYERLVNGSVGTSDLVEFLRLDPGAVFRKDPAAKAFKMVRIIAGNPLIMKKMAERVSDAATAILDPVLLLRRTALVLSLVGLASTVSFAIRSGRMRSAFAWRWERSKRMSCGSSFE